MPYTDPDTGEEFELPAEVDEIRDLVCNNTRGATKIHKSPYFKEAVEVLIMFCLDQFTGTNKQVMEWHEVAKEIREEFPGLHVNGLDIEYFCTRYILPNVTVTKNDVLKGVLRRAESLDVIGELMDIKKKSQSAFEEAIAKMGEVTEGKDGRLVKTGTTAAEVASLSRANLSVYKEVIKELERFGIIPSQKPGRDAPQVNVTNNVDLAGAMRGLMGRTGGVENVRDATYREKPRSTDPSPAGLEEEEEG